MAGLAALPLDEIASEALKVNCGAGNCWAAPGQPCACDRPGGKHLARFARARRRGLISDADLCAVLDAVAPDPDSVFTPESVIYDDAEVPA